MEHTYLELPPPALLAGHLTCLWTETTRDRTDLPPMRILPDGCIDIVWTAGRPPIVAGPATQAAFPSIPPGSRLVGARFRPGMASGVLGAPASELANLEVPLSDLWGRVPAQHLGPFDGSGQVQDGLVGLRALLVERLDRIDGTGDPIVTVLARRLADQPVTPLSALRELSGLSERQLRRRFEAAVGYGPKTFQRIARFLRWLALVSAASRDQRRLTDLAATAGYADQAHLTREVTRLAGLPPAALLATRESADG